MLALPGCALDDAGALVERPRSATPGGRTGSAGVACRDRSEDPEALLGRAARTLYSAKRAGATAPRAPPRNP